MRKYEPTTELIMMLIDVREYSAAANVELAFVDSFEGCADLIAAGILKLARSGEHRGLESLVIEINDTIGFHYRWERTITQLLLKDEHQNRDADCLKQALAQTKSVRRLLERQVVEAAYTLHSLISLSTSTQKFVQLTEDQTFHEVLH